MTEKANPTEKQDGSMFQRLVAHFMKSASPEELADALRDGALGKAADDIAKPTMAEHVDSGPLDGDKTKAPSRTEIKTGSGQHASGSGASKMIEEYSDPDAQKGAQRAAERLGEMLEEWRAMKSAFGQIVNETGFLKAGMISILERQAALDKLVKSGLAKAEDKKDEEKDEDKDDEKDGKKNPFAKAEDKEEHEDKEEDDEKKAKSLRADARKYLSIAKSLFADSDRLEEAEKPKSAKAKAEAAALKFAKAYALAKAAAGVAESEHDGALLAQIAAVGKARKLNPDNQNVWPDEGGEKDDRKTVKADEPLDPAAVMKAVQDIRSKVEKALAGQGAFEMTQQQMFDMLMSKSRSSGPPVVKGDVPDFVALMKSDPQKAMEAKSAEISGLYHDGKLDFEQMTVAKNILTRMGAAAAGLIDAEVPPAMIARAPAAVQQIFPRQAA